MSVPDGPPDLWMPPSPLDPERERREMRRALAPLFASFAPFLVAALTVSINSRAVDEFALAMIAALFVVAGRLGGIAPGLYAALMGSLSFDFFDVAPIRVLHAGTLSLCFAAMSGLALLASRRPPSP
jgi:K+-sensing histidine kinase KdpD